MRSNYTILLIALFSLINSIICAQTCPVSSCSTMKYIRINIHFMLKDEGSGNFNEKNDGIGSTSINGYKYAQNIVSDANNKLANNPLMTQPTGNILPACSISYRYVLSGVYFHRSNDYYDFESDVLVNDSHFSGVSKNQIYIDRFGRNRTNEINIFLQEDVDNGDVAGIASSVVGIPGNSFVNLSYAWTYYKVHSLSVSISELGHLINHEVGHLLGLYHPFDVAELCNDTPDPFNYPNCGPSSDNNVMGYSCMGEAFTPCQLGIVYNNLSGVMSPYTLCCANPPNIPLFSLPDPNVCFGETIYLDGSWRLSKPETGYSIEIYQTCFPENGTLGSSDIISGTYWSSSFSGNYGKINLSTLYPYFRAGKVYRVKLTINDPCAGNVSQVRYLNIMNNQNTVYLQNQTVTGTSSFAATNVLIAGKDVNPSHPPEGKFKVTGTALLSGNYYVDLKPGTEFALNSKVSVLLQSNSCDPGRNNLRETSDLDDELGSVSEDVKCYPNPFNDAITLDFNCKKDQEIKIALINSLGQKTILLRDNELYKEGFHSLEFSLMNIPSGLYFIELKGADYNKLVKVIKL